MDVLEAVVALNQEGKQLIMKNIADKLNETIDGASGEKKITPHMVGRINKNYLRLPTHRIGGRYEIMWNPEQIKKLCSRYDVEFPERDEFVEQIEETFGTKQPNGEIKSPKSTVSPTPQGKKKT